MANKNHCHQLIVAIVTSLMVFGAYGQQTFDITPSATTGSLGDTVTLQCASSDKTGQLMWIRTGRLISRDTEVLLNADRYSITGDQSAGQYFLTITDLAIDDAGTYYCILSQGGGNAATSTPGVDLTVIETTEAPTATPQPPQSFRAEPQDITVQFGSTLVLQCEIDNRVGDVLWLRSDTSQIISNGRVVIADGFTDRYSVIGNEANGEYNLQIINVESSDDGVIVCFVDGSGNVPAITSRAAKVTAVTQVPTTIAPTTKVTTQARVTTKAAATVPEQTTAGRTTQKQDQTTQSVVTTPTTPPPPQSFGEQPDDTTVQMGSTVVLNCQINNKAGDVQWIKVDNSLLISTERSIEATALATRYSITGDQSNGEFNLRISDAEASDAGGFMCHAKASGTVSSINSRIATLTVSEGSDDPDVEYPLCAMIGDVIRGQTIVLSCYSNVGSSAANLVWRQDDVYIEPTYTDTGNGISSHLSFVVDDDLEGALFTCTSIHTSYTEPKMCTFPPIKVKSKQIEVDVLPVTLKKKVEESGMFECAVESTEAVICYVWSFDSEEIDVTSDDRFKLMANDTVLLIPNITKEMDESEVECTVTTANYTESATARIEIVEDDEGWNSVSLAIVIAIIIVVIVVIIVSLVLFYCLWWKKRHEKYPLVTANEQVVEEDTATVAPGPVASGNPDVLGGKQPDAVYKNGQLNAAYTVENEIPLSKSISLPPIRSHTPVGGRPQTADLDLHREQPVYSKSKKSKKHKNKKKKRHNLIGPTELKPVKENGRQYSDKPRVLEHFVVDSGSGDSPRRDTDSVNSNKDVDNHHYESPQPLPSKSPKRSRKFEDEPDGDERPRSPTPESHRPRSPTPDKQQLRDSERKHRRRRSVDDDDEDRHRDRPKSSKHRSRSSSERHSHRRSRDESREEKRERRHRRSRSRRHRDSRDFSDVSDAEHDVRRSNKELKTRESEHSPMDADDDREKRRSHRRGEKSRERHKHSRKSRDRHDSPHDD